VLAAGGRIPVRTASRWRTRCCSRSPTRWPRRRADPVAGPVPGPDGRRGAARADPGAVRQGDDPEAAAKALSAALAKVA
jgi:hypothetical protein